MRMGLRYLSQRFMQQGGIISAIGGAIEAVISAIAGCVMAVVGGITGVRLFPRNYLSSKSSQLSFGLHNRFCWRSGISSWPSSAAAASVRAGARVTLAPQWGVEHAGEDGRRLRAHMSYLKVHSSHVNMSYFGREKARPLANNIVRVDVQDE